MSDQTPDPTDPDNPYNTRDHESTRAVSTKADVLAVANLLGQVSGELSHIDKQNVGGDSQYIKARTMDPKAALQNIVGVNPTAPIEPSATPHQGIMPTPAALHPSPRAIPPAQPSDINVRLTSLEKIVESYKKITKFKRGISYTINTSKIKGEFKDPGDIIDIISSELAKGTKTITIKLNDTTKNK